MLRQAIRLVSITTRGVQQKTINVTIPFKRNFQNLTFQPQYCFALPKHKEMTMPALSPTMDKGNIMKWLKQVGDKVEPGDVICEVETDKATVGFEVQEEGYIAKILKPEGTQGVSVGELVALLVRSKKDVEAFVNYEQAKQEQSQPSQPQSQPHQQQTQAPPQQPPQQQASGKTYPKHTKLGLPALSPTMEKGNLMKWLKKEGDKIEAGDVICEVETDKASVGFEVQEEGYLAKILVPEGAQDLTLGTVLAILTPKKDFLPQFSDYSGQPSAQQPSSAQPAQQQQAQPAQQQQAQPTQQQQQQAQPVQQQQQQSQPQQTISQQPESSSDRVFASPLAKQFAREQNVDVSQVQGTGIEGSVTKGDVERYLQSKPAQQEAPKPSKTEAKTEAKPTAAVTTGQTTGVESNPYQDTEVTNMRKIIANRLLESKITIPHYYLTIRVQMDAVMKLREELNKVSKTKISVNDFIVKASALALKDVPDVNSQWNGSTIRKFTNADICVAVSTDNGLITPIVFNAGAKGLSTISSTTKSLAEKARTNKLKPQEFQGGTFTISNLGMFGIDQFIAVINPPQAAILAVGKTSKVVVPEESDETKHKVVSLMDVTLSCDHRVVDGAVGAQWLQRFKAYMEQPSTMIL